MRAEGVKEFDSTAALRYPGRMMELSLLEQVVAVANAYLLKPAYMLLLLYIAIRLHRRAEDADLRPLKYGVSIFLLGEAFCAVNFLFFSDTNAAVEWLHGMGMVIGAGGISLGLLHLMDRRMAFFSEAGKPCFLMRTCRDCVKKTRTACGLERVFLFLSLSLAVLNLMPLLSPLRPFQKEMTVFGTQVCLQHPLILEVFEYRVYPLLGSAFFLTSAIILLVVRKEPVRYAKYPFSLAVGFLTFPLLRYLTTNVYYDNLVWALFWEEATELMLAAGLWVFLSSFPLEGKPPGHVALGP